MSKTNPNIICSTCRYFESIDPESGYCNLDPHAGMERLTVFGNHWCSYWTSISGSIQTDSYRNSLPTGTLLYNSPSTPLPASTGTFLDMDYETRLYQEGKIFQYTYPLTSIPNKNPLNFILSPDYNLTSIIAEFDCSQVTASLYESPSINSILTPAQTKNVNRHSSALPKMKVYLVPSLNNFGTLLDQITSPNPKIENWILNKGNIYLLRLESVSGSVGLRLRWYEDNSLI